MSLLLLVRHGQASFGAADYDVLSDRGRDQARLLGEAYAARGLRVDRIVHGGMRRQADTAAALATFAGWRADRTEDDGWAEFDHVGVVAAYEREVGESLPPAASPKEFQRRFLEATARWEAAGPSTDGGESFADFVARAGTALDRLRDVDGTVVVVTSGGVIGVLASLLLTGTTSLWSDLNTVAVNAGVTKVLQGAAGRRLLSFNDHAHLEHDRTLITYR